MGIFDFLLKSRNSTKKTIRTINGIPTDMMPIHVYENKFVWANDKVGNSNLTIGNIVMLWWLDKYHDVNRRIPDYFEKNYVDSFDAEVKKLISEGWINPDGALTSKGTSFLNCNSDIIEKHRNGWMTDADKKSFSFAQKEDFLETNNWLRSVGLTEIADRDTKNRTESERQMELRKQFNHAERLAKDNQIDLSNQILNSLITEKFRQTAPLYERLAKNYRKQKNYEKEIEVCQTFLDTEQPKYGGVQWIDVFQKRIDFAQKKLS